MQETHNPAYAAWMTAETEAYIAIHGLHQFTCGARKPMPLAALQKIEGLRQKADAAYAELRRALCIDDTVVPITAVRERSRSKLAVLPPVEERAYLSGAARSVG